MTFKSMSSLFQKLEDIELKLALKDAHICPRYHGKRLGSCRYIGVAKYPYISSQCPSRV
jgi:hypothetical protein